MPDGKPSVPELSIAVIPGDGIGGEVIAVGKAVVEAAAVAEAVAEAVVEAAEAAAEAAA